MFGELAALGTAICWTISAVLYKKALVKTNPISANIVRCTSSSIALIVALVAIGKVGTLTDVSLYAVVLTSVSGIVGLGLGDTLYMTSLKVIGVARAVPITCTYPLFSILLAIFLQREVVTLHIVLGAVVIVLGIWLLSQEEEKAVNRLSRRELIKGVASSLATAAIWAVSISLINIAVTLPEAKSLDHALAVNTIRILATAMFLLGSSPIADKNFDLFKMEKGNLLAIFSGGLVALALGWFLLTMSFLYIQESRAVPISSTSPLFAMIAGIIYLHEPLTAKTVAGSLIVTAGIFLIFVV